MRRKRLAVVMLGEGSCQKSLDSLISSLWGFHKIK
jgi:hypothetical protein